MNRVPKSEQRRFYDGWVVEKVAAGVNDRHLAIEAVLRRAGWKPGHSVLEVGAGVGQLTGLLARGLGPTGRLVGVDLSPHSIDAARERLRRVPRVTLLAGDILDADLDGPFDVIVLPDVIEHIPVELHARLFAKLSGLLAGDGFLLLNYPNPYYLRWLHAHRRDLLQPLDQPIDADVLVSVAARSGLYLASLQTYSIWVPEGDYVSATFRPVPLDPTFTPGGAVRGQMIRSRAQRLRLALRRR